MREARPPAFCIGGTDRAGASHTESDAFEPAARKRRRIFGVAAAARAAPLSDEYACACGLRQARAAALVLPRARGTPRAGFDVGGGNRSAQHGAAAVTAVWRNASFGRQPVRAPPRRREGIAPRDAL